MTTRTIEEHHRAYWHRRPGNCIAEREPVSQTWCSATLSVLSRGIRSNFAPQALIVLARSGTVRGYPQPPATLPYFEPYEPQILRWAES